MPATTHASATSRWRWRSPRSARSARSIARPIASATFISSDGCRLMPPGSRIQERDPLTVDPSGETTAASPRTART